MPKCLVDKHERHKLDAQENSSEKLKTFAKNTTSDMIEVSQNDQKRGKKINHHHQVNIELEEKCILQNREAIAVLESKIEKCKEKVARHKREKNKLLEFKRKNEEKKRLMQDVADRVERMNESGNPEDSRKMVALTFKMMNMVKEFETEKMAFDQSLNDYWQNYEDELQDNVEYQVSIFGSRPSHVQSNQKMHDLYATKHISQMVLPDAFWAV